MLDKDTQKWLHDQSQQSKAPHRLNGIHIVDSDYGNLAVTTDGFRIAYAPTDLELDKVLKHSKYPIQDGKFPDVSVFFRDYATEAYVDTGELFYALNRVYAAGLKYDPGKVRPSNKGEVTGLVWLERQDQFDDHGIVRIILNTSEDEVIAEAVVSATITGESRWAKLKLYWMIQALGGWGKIGKTALHKFGSHREYKPTISFKRDYDNETTVIGMNNFSKQAELRSDDEQARGVILMPYTIPSDKVGGPYGDKEKYASRNPVQLLELKQPTRPTNQYEHAYDTSSENWSTPRTTTSFHIDSLEEFVNSNKVIPTGYTLSVVYRDRFGWSLLQRSDHTTPTCYRLMKYVYDEDGNQSEELDFETSRDWFGRFYTQDARSDTMTMQESNQAIRLWIQRSNEDIDADIWWSLDYYKRYTDYRAQPVHVEVPTVLVEQYKALQYAMERAGLSKSLSLESKGKVDPDRNWIDYFTKKNVPYKPNVSSCDHVGTTTYKYKLVNLRAKLELDGLWPNENQPYFNPTKNDTYDYAENIVLRQQEYTRSGLLSELSRATKEKFFINCANAAKDAALHHDFNTVFKYYKMFQPYLHAWYEEYETDPVGVLTAMVIVRYWNYHHLQH